MENPATKRPTSGELYEEHARQKRKEEALARRQQAQNLVPVDKLPTLD